MKVGPTVMLVRCPGLTVETQQPLTQVEKRAKESTSADAVVLGIPSPHIREIPLLVAVSSIEPVGKKAIETNPIYQERKEDMKALQP